MSIIKKTPEKLIIKDKISTSLANAVRRSVEEILSLAVDEVEIYRNDSALYDEVLAHRIGLLPLKTDSKMSSKTEVEFKLKKTGPCTVYSGDLKGRVKVVFEKIPLTVLEDKQDIELVATARLGSGIEHAKHVPGLMYYRNLLEIKSGNNKIDEIIKKSTGEIKPEKKGSKWICDLKDSEVDEINLIDKDSVSDSDELLIVIESYGHLDADKILEKAIEAFGKNLDNFEKLIK